MYKRQVYGYDTKFTVYTHDPEGELVRTDGSTGNDLSHDASLMGEMAGMSGMSGMMRSGNYEQLMPKQDGSGVSNALTDTYEVLYGSWPDAYNEVVRCV